MAGIELDVTTVGQLLRARRGAFTQRELAELVGVDHTSIARFESGKRLPSLDVIRKLAEVLSFSDEDWRLVRSLNGKEE